MSTWILNEKGRPEDGSWELSIVHRDNEHGIRSYGWEGDDKLIVWSSGGPCSIECDQVVAKHVRKAALAALDELNGACNSANPV